MDCNSGCVATLPISYISCDDCRNLQTIGEKNHTAATFEDNDRHFEHSGAVEERKHAVAIKTALEIQKRVRMAAYELFCTADSKPSDCKYIPPFKCNCTVTVTGEDYYRRRILTVNYGHERLCRYIYMNKNTATVIIIIAGWLRVENPLVDAEIKKGDLVYNRGETVHRIAEITEIPTDKYKYYRGREYSFGHHVS